MRTHILTALSFMVFLFSSTMAYAADCSSTVYDLYSWVSSSRYVKVKMIGHLADNRYAFYAEGDLTNKEPQDCLGGTCIPARISGDLHQQFSDRVGTYYKDQCNQSKPGCIGSETSLQQRQRFDIKKTDVLGVQVRADSSVVLTLKSWGNGTGKVPVTCSNGLMYGELNGTMYVFTFVKKEKFIPH